MRLVLTVLLLLLVGCVSRPIIPVDYVHTTSREQAWEIAGRWRAADPANREIGRTAYTGSMKPLLYGGELLLLERYRGQPIVAGQIIVFDRGDVKRVLHRVVCDGGDTGSFLTMGDNCSRPDGWHSKEKIKAICVGIVAPPQ